MSNLEGGHSKPDFKLSAVCGHFCAACSLFIGSEEEPERLEGISKRTNRTVEELTCCGCRSAKKSFYCTTVCKMRECAQEHQVDFCSFCDEYPCVMFKEFAEEAADRIEVKQCLDRVRDVGFKKWYVEMIERYSCPKCHTLNSAYDMSCRKCGAEPGSKYVEENHEEILRRMK